MIYIIKKSRSFVTIILPLRCKQRVNATGLKSSKDIEHYKCLFEQKYAQQCKSVRVDNILFFNELFLFVLDLVVNPI